MKIRTKLKLIYFRNCLKVKLSGNSSNNYIKYKDKNKRKVWIFLGADYGNLGDVAITLSQSKFLKKIYSDSEIITVPISGTLRAIPKIKQAIGKNDIVTIIGGGNISDLYEDIEFLRQQVIKSFPDNKIISFPQSVYLTRTLRGEAEKKRIRRIYGSHKNLLMLMRDEVSFQRMKKILPKANVRLAPDIVMSEDYRKESSNRERKIFLCLRNDKESPTSDKVGLQKLIEELKSKQFEIVQCDTQIEDDLVRAEGGEYHLNKILQEIRESSLVITNRLHGMIFAFITGTPAIVLDNSTGKVSATYEWIKDCGYIQMPSGKIDFNQLNFTDNFEEVSLRIKHLLEDNLK